MKIIFYTFLSLLSVQVQANFFSDLLISKKARDAYQAQNYSEAESAYTQMLSAKPYDVQNNYNLGCALHKQKKFNDAHHAFTRAIDHAGTNTKLQEQALFNRGNNFAVQKKFDEAIVDYKKVLKINPENEPAKKNLQACELMKKEEKKEQQQKDKNKKQDKNKKNQKQDQSQDSQSQDSQDQDSQNQDSNNDNSSEQSNKKDQSSKEQKKNQQVSKKQGSKDQSQDQKGDAQQEAQEEQKNKEEQADGLEKSKNQKSKAEQNRQEQKKEEKHKKSLEKSSQKQSSKSDENGKEASAQQDSAQQDVELNDAYASDMINKPSSDDRLAKKSAKLLEKLDDYEKNIQKKLLQLNVTKQGAQKHGQKNW